MRRPLARLLGRHRPQLKAEWSRRLLAQRARPALPGNLTLPHLMDVTLDQLGSLLQASAPGRWLEHHQPISALLRNACECGLNPLLEYFVAGHEALGAVLQDSPELKADDWQALDGCWHLLAQNEVQGLCAECRRVCAPALSFPVTAAPAEPAFRLSRTSGRRRGP